MIRQLPSPDAEFDDHHTYVFFCEGFEDWLLKIKLQKVTEQHITLGNNPDLIEFLEFTAFG